LTGIQRQIEQQMVDLDLQKESTSGVVIDVERAAPPDSPAFPKPLLNIVVALVLGLVVGCYYALLLHYLEGLGRNE